MHEGRTGVRGTDPAQRRSWALALAAGMLAALGPGAASAAASFAIEPVGTVAESAGHARVTVTKALVDGAGSVRLSTADGTARSVQDYSAVSTVVSFGLLETSKTVDIPIAADLSDEHQETFTVGLSDAQGAGIDAAAGSRPVGIADDDAPPALHVGDLQQAEGTAAGPSAFAVPVSVSIPSGKEIAVHVRTADPAPGEPAATAGQDYTAHGDHVLAIPAGTASTSVPVDVAADSVDEDAERFAVEFFDAQDASLTAPGARSAAVVTVDDDDTAAVSIGNAGQPEGTGGSTGFAFPVTLSTPSAKRVSVDFATADGPGPSPAPAVAPGDYQPTSGTVTFEPGETGGKAITVPVAGDALAEPNEIFVVALSNPQNAVLDAASVGIGGIFNDDGGTVTPTSTTTAGQRPGGGGLTSLPPGFGEPERARITISRIRTARRGQARFTVRCAAAEQACRGQVTLFTVPRRRARIRALRAERKLGTVKFTIATGRSQQLRVTVSRRMRRTLRGVKSVKVRGYVVARDAAGRIGTARGSGTLRIR